MKREAGNYARFKGYSAEPERVVALAPDNPAVVEGRTLFPGKVIGADDSMRFLVSGRNSSKTGAEVVKGDWRGMPIFTLTLEERATCPRSCEMWAGCYGNAMQWAPRRDHRDPRFLENLSAELITLARAHPKGVVIRLHILGDFFSTAYVRLWADMLDRFPQLHVFGYTHRRTDADDEESRKIAAALAWMADTHWEAFAVRLSSSEPGRQRTIVVDEPISSKDIITCPAQLKDSETCGTCGLCWAEAARDKTIAFLRHGIKRKPPTERPPPAQEITAADRIAALPEGEKMRISKQYGARFK